MSPYHRQEESEEVFHRYVASIENPSFGANEPLITSSSKAKDDHDQEHHPAATSNLLNTQSDGASSMLVLASLFLGFAVSFLAHLIDIYEHILLQAITNNDDSNNDILKPNIRAILSATMNRSLAMALVMAVVYHLFLLVVVSIVKMVNNTNESTIRDNNDTNTQLLFLEQITTHTCFQMLLGDLVGACSAFTVASLMLGETKLVPLCLGIMLTSVGLANGIMFYCSTIENKSSYYNENNSSSSNCNSHDYDHHHDHEIISAGESLTTLSDQQEQHDHVYILVV